jgi:hypothetical protein
MAEALGMQGIDRGVVERAAPLVGDHRATVRKSGTGRNLFS